MNNIQNSIYIYEFISPIIVEESFLVDEQEYYVKNIDENLFDKIQIVMNKFMDKLGEKGLAQYLDNFLKDNIKRIYLYPILENGNLICKTIVISNTQLSSINKGILLDFLEDEFMNGIGVKLSNIDIICDIQNNEYRNKIYKKLQILNIPYTVRLNFYNYNNFYLKNI